MPLVLKAAVRDRTTVPSFMPVDFGKHLAALLLANNDLELAERQRRFTILVNQPDLYNSTTQHVRVRGIPAYRFFPRVSLDFSSSIASASPLDRVSFLLIIVRLRTTCEACAPREAADDGGEGVRFLDFSPKESDFVDFTRGQFTQALQAAVAANATVVDTVGATTNDEAGSGTANRQNTVGLAPSVTLSESYVSALTDAIERRSAGLLDDQTFYAAFRSLREIRIGGTYNFDLMLLVPSREGAGSSSARSVWEPVTKEVRADIYMMGVVRHVYSRGMTGIRVRVPESENDDVYEQVVVESVRDAVLWRHNEEPWIGTTAVQQATCRVDVFTNRADALFLAEDGNGSVVAAGGGTRTSLEVPVQVDAEECTAVVRFLPIVEALPSGVAVTLEAPSVDLTIDAEGARSAVGIYQ